MRLTKLSDLRVNCSRHDYLRQDQELKLTESFWVGLRGQGGGLQQFRFREVSTSRWSDIGFVSSVMEIEGDERVGDMEERSQNHFGVLCRKNDKI
ncbi:hypothetical protein Bca101_055698 [Brassica carinata]